MINHVMNKQFLFLCFGILGAICLSSCYRDVDYVGKGDFIVENVSSESITAVLYIRDGRMIYSSEIKVNSSGTVCDTTIFLESVGLQLIDSMYIYRHETDGSHQTLLYKQCPIDYTKWVTTEVENSYWLTSNHFVFSNDLIQL